MSNSDLYYTAHWSWNILFNVGPIAKTMEVLCLLAEWQVCHKAGHTQTPFPGILLEIQMYQGQDSCVHTSELANHAKASQISVEDSGKADAPHLFHKQKT